MRGFVLYNEGAHRTSGETDRRKVNFETCLHLCKQIVYEAVAPYQVARSLNVQWLHICTQYTL